MREVIGMSGWRVKATREGRGGNKATREVEDFVKHAELLLLS